MAPLNNFQYPGFLLAMHNVMHAQHRHSILVIYENECSGRSLGTSLKTSFTIIECQGSDDGLAMAHQCAPDLIITEQLLERNDESICYRLKNDENAKHIPVIIVSDRDDQYCRIKSFYNGADDFIVMPFQLLELQVRIQNLIQSRKILQEKYCRHIDLHPSPVKVQSQDDQFLQRAMEVVEENMDNPMFGSEDFARALGLSQTRLYRKLVSLTGYSSNDFIRKIRLKRAADLLQKQAGNVSEIAYRVGFNSLSYFAKCFKQFHRHTPSDYVRRMCS